MQDEKKTTYTAAKKRANERYIAEKTDDIGARLPRGYGENCIKSQKRRAQARRKC